MTVQPNVIPMQPDNPSLSRLRDLVEQQWLSHGPENAIDGLRLTRALEPSGTIRALYQTSFCIVLQGAKVTAVGESAFHYRQGECLLASVNVPVNSRIVQAAPDKPYLALSLSIDPAMISELLVTRPEMAYRGPKQPALVTAWMQANYQQPFRVAELAAMASMSPATFHRHFKSITRLTPVQFQKLVRLQEARRLLLSDQDVASVGYQVGYESPSQFSRDYRKLFGAPPGRDKAVMRSSVAIESGV